MRFVLQRVREASVIVDGQTVGAIGEGLLLFAGFGAFDPPGMPETGAWRSMSAKVADLRVFPDDAGKLNQSLRQRDGELLIVSQFTLHADCRKGRRPSFHLAASPATALALYDRLLADFETLLPGRTASGRFGADMDVRLVNWGPVTILLDSDDFQCAREDRPA